MFEKIGQSAEKVVTKFSLSRRGFLGSAAKKAAALGAGLAVLAVSPAQAGHGVTCLYYCEDGSYATKRVSDPSACPSGIKSKGTVCFLADILSP